MLKHQKVKIIRWSDIKWKDVEIHVLRLQESIFVATRNNEIAEVRRLQRLIINSINAKLLAVRKCTQDNREKKVSGVDGILALTPEARLNLALTLKIDGKSSPIKRIMIPKPDGKMRSVGIPTIRDRCLQALVKLGIEPEHEAKFETKSYGFRPGRSYADALKHVFNAIQTEGKYVLHVDIENYLDKIDHEVLLKLCGYEGKIKKQIRAWLKAGALKDFAFIPSETRASQGEVISPLLANIALDGFQNYIEEWCTNNTFCRNGKQLDKRTRIRAVLYTRYGANIRIFCHNLTVITELTEHLKTFLQARGLNLNAEKIYISHTLENTELPAGASFLGFTIKHFKSTHYGFKSAGRFSKEKIHRGIKLRIYPEREKITEHFRNMRKWIRKIVKDHKKLIDILNPIIASWTNYFRISYLSSMSLRKRLAKSQYYQLRAWAKRKHIRFTQKVYKKYWINNDGRKTFGYWKTKKDGTKELVTLLTHADIYFGYSLVRYVKVRSNKSIYDGDIDYWAARSLVGRETKMRTSLLKKQKGQCAMCKLKFRPTDVIEVDHIIPVSEEGSNAKENLRLVHAHCHDQKQS